MKKNNNKIVFTGGHAGTTALSLVEEIKKQKINWEIHWIGPQKPTEGKSFLSLEFKYFNKYKVIFHPIIAGRIQRKFSFWTIPSIIKIPLGFLHAFFLIKKIKPFVVLSFGGFASFPVVVISKFFKVPVLIHEQTVAAGRSNILSAKFAEKILISRKSSEKYFLKRKCILVGNPILSHYFSQKNLNNLKTNTILVIGGSRGSQQINSLIEKMLAKILKDFSLIHLTGEPDFEKFLKIKKDLPDELGKKYSIYSSIDPYEIKDLYLKADFVISRSGANTISELIALKKPAIFIPIPWSYLDEQNENAQYASEFIPVKILNQNILNEEKFLKEIYSFADLIFTFSNKKSPDEKASVKIVEIIKTYSK